MRLRRAIHTLSRRFGMGPKGGGRLDFAEVDARVAEYRRRGTTIGKKVRLLGNIDGVNPHLVSIGDYTVVGRECALLAHCPVKGALPCRVGSYVYLAWGVIVLPGVSIGDRCIVGAGAVVTKDVPPGWVVAGNPARPLRPLTPTEIGHIERVMHNDLPFGADADSGTPREG